MLRVRVQVRVRVGGLWVHGHVVQGDEVQVRQVKPTMALVLIQTMSPHVASHADVTEPAERPSFLWHNRPHCLLLPWSCSGALCWRDKAALRPNAPRLWVSFVWRAGPRLERDG
ncbi:unnamed protein product [Merluccius merluccius]